MWPPCLTWIVILKADFVSSSEARVVRKWTCLKRRRKSTNGGFFNEIRANGSTLHSPGLPEAEVKRLACALKR